MAVAAGTKFRPLCLLGPPPVSRYYIRTTVMIIIHGPRYCCLAPGLLLQFPNTYTSKTHRSESHQQPSSETTDLVSLPAPWIHPVCRASVGIFVRLSILFAFMSQTDVMFQMTAGEFAAIALVEHRHVLCALCTPASLLADKPFSAELTTHSTHTF
jgi:hypothetical protein